MSAIFAGDVGTEIVLDCGIDISSASVLKIHARKSSCQTVVWDAELDGTTAIKHVTTDGDLDVAGEWQLQAYVEIGSLKCRGEIATLTVQEAL